MSSAARRVSVEMLEDRLLCARTPSDPTPSTIGRTFDLGERKALLARLTDLPSHTADRLAKYLKGHHTGAFDDYLLSYMRSRTDAKYYYDPNDAGTIASYVKAHFSTTTQKYDADEVTDDRLFPQESSSTKYTVQLPANIDWNSTAYSKDSEFLPTLQRQAWWADLAQTYRYTGDAKYMKELQYELASWSQQTPTFELTHDHEVTYAFTVGVRVDFQMQAYFSVLDSSGWTGAANSLMLYKFMQQGDLLKSANGYAAEEYDTNRSTSIGKAELLLGEVFPEFDTASQWETGGRTVVTDSMAAQFYADGSQREQSPGYALNVLDDLLDAAEIDKINGNTWDTTQQATLKNIVVALWQQLSPNGNRPALGDTYRLSGAGKFTKATLVLGDLGLPQNKANNSDVWEFGTAAGAAHLHDQNSDLGDRGSTYSLPDSGNYILRSGDGSGANQINYTAGPKGGVHGHYDYMSFELFGSGRPLIADPGPYEYTDSPERTWVTSAAAHNTISVSGTNPADLENSSDFLNSGITQVAGGSMLSSSYHGYNFLDGDPTLSRTLWYDGHDTIVVVDFASASSATSFETGFTVEGQNNNKHDLDDGTFYTTNGSGNVRIQSLLGKHQSASVRTKGVFTSSLPAPNDYDPATHYYASQKGTFAVFATVITAYGGSAASAKADVSWVRQPTKAGQTAILSINGQHVEFPGLQFAQVGKNGQVKGEDNSIAYDAKGRLHMAFYDPATQTLKYAVRNTKGVWGDIQTIDGNVGSGLTPSLAIDSDGYAVAYQDGANSDLKYAYVSPDTNSWVVQTVDAKGSTGAYPDLVFSRTDGAIIAYYDHTHGDLKVATSQKGGFSVSTVDSKGDVGRFASIQLDPNRPDASKFAVAYEDETTHSFKYAIQAKSGYDIETIDASTKQGGGYVSMAFFDDGDESEPAVSYYDQATGHLKFATRHGGVWSSSVIASGKRQGQYSQLQIVKNAPQVYYFDATKNQTDVATAARAWKSKFSSKEVADGGRDLSTAAYGSHVAFTTFDAKTGYLTVAG